MALVLFDNMNARECLEAASTWLGYHHEDMSFGLKCPEDGIKLWRYMRAHDDLSDMADDWTYDQRVEAIGYCPFRNYSENELAP